MSIVNLDRVLYQEITMEDKAFELLQLMAARLGVALEEANSEDN